MIIKAGATEPLELALVGLKLRRAEAQATCLGGREHL